MSEVLGAMPKVDTLRLRAHARNAGQTVIQYVLSRCDDVSYSEFIDGKEAYANLRSNRKFSAHGKPVAYHFTATEQQDAELQEYAEILTEGNVSHFINIMMLLT